MCLRIAGACADGLVSLELNVLGACPTLLGETALTCSRSGDACCCEGEPGSSEASGAQLVAVALPAQRAMIECLSE